METQYPLSYISYLSEFHATRDYFECHELLEEYWKAHQGEPLTDTWHGLIQVAVGLYHHRRGNRAGALKMWSQALLRLSPERLEELGLDASAMLAELQRRRDSLRDEAAFPYTDMELPIRDPKLKQQCLALCAEQGWTWGLASEAAGEDVIHRHLTRDRSDVVAARADAAAEKRSRRGLSS